MRCPVCKTLDLNRTTYEGLGVWQCVQCRGHFVESLRVKGIIRRSKRTLGDLENEALLDRAEDSKRIVGCPRCGTQMRKINKARPVRFQIDECHGCSGLWLDGGELALLQLSYEGTPQQEEAREMRRRLEEMPPERKREFENNMKKLKADNHDSFDLAALFDLLNRTDWE